MLTYPRNDRSRANGGPFADGAEWQNGHVASNEAVFLNPDRTSPKDPTVSFDSDGRIDTGRQAVELDVGSYNRTIANEYRGGILQEATAADGDILADVDVIAIFTAERCFNRHQLTYCPGRTHPGTHGIDVGLSFSRVEDSSKTSSFVIVAGSGSGAADIIVDLDGATARRAIFQQLIVLEVPIRHTGQHPLPVVEGTVQSIAKREPRMAARVSACIALVGGADDGWGDAWRRWKCGSIVRCLISRRSPRVGKAMLRRRWAILWIEGRWK